MPSMRQQKVRGEQNKKVFLANKGRSVLENRNYSKWLPLFKSGNWFQILICLCLVSSCKILRHQTSLASETALWLYSQLNPIKFSTVLSLLFLTDTVVEVYVRYTTTTSPPTVLWWSFTAYSIEYKICCDLQLAQGWFTLSFLSHTV